MALYHKSDVKNDFLYVLQFFLLISEGLVSVKRLPIKVTPNSSDFKFKWLYSHDSHFKWLCIEEDQGKNDGEKFLFNRYTTKIGKATWVFT